MRVNDTSLLMLVLIERVMSMLSINSLCTTVYSFDALCRELYGHPCYFADLRLCQDRTWLLNIGSQQIRQIVST